MSTDKVTTFTALHDAMSETIKAALPAVKVVEALEDEPPADTVALPAVFVGVEEIGGTKKLGGGRLAVQCTMVAYCLLSKKARRSSLQIVNLAASVASVVDSNRWGLQGCAEMPKAITASPATFTKGGDGAEAWAVSWEQTIHIGDQFKHEGSEGIDDFDGFWLASCHPDLHKLPGGK